MNDRPPRTAATDPLPRPSRRAFLGGLGASASAATAGCLGSVLDSSPQQIEPVEPAEPREGTPGEFYSLVERNDIDVESLTRDGPELTLTYHSTAEDEESSTEEISKIVTVYNENLVKNGAGIDVLYAEVVDPFEGQAYGWGVQTEWLERYNDEETNGMTLWSSILSSRVYADDVEGEANGSDSDEGATSDSEGENADGEAGTD